MTRPQQGKNTEFADLIKLASETAAKTAIKTLRDEQRQQQKEMHKRILHNTKLLLHNYRMFKEHTDTSINELEEISENTFQIFEAMMLRPASESKVFVNSITHSMAKTTIVMEHIEEAVDVYRAYCEKSKNPENMRRYRIIDVKYISGDTLLTNEEIAEKENIACRTVYKDIEAAVKMLSVLIFGVDGLRYE